MPLNSVGLMPGRLEHTNEVTVLLGDNYFAERSATQARDILGRRIEHVSRLAKEEEAALDEALGQQLAGEQVQQRLDKLRAGVREGQEGVGGQQGGGLREVDIREAYDDPPAPAPAPLRPEPEPEAEPAPGVEAGAAALPAHMYGMSPTEYAACLDGMEGEELRSAVGDFGLSATADASDERLRAMLRRHLLGKDGARRAVKGSGLKGGFFGGSPKRKAARRKEQGRGQPAQGRAPRGGAFGGDSSGLGGVVERAPGEGQPRPAQAARAAGAGAPEAAPGRARVSRFKAARQQGRAQQ